MVKWNSDYSVGVKKFDDEHAKLFDLIDEMAEAMKAKKATEELSRIITELVEYTKKHFTDEEAIMKRVGYGGILEQQKAHAQFVDKVTEWKERIDNGDILFLSSAIFTYLNKWLVEHIQRVDKKYSATMASAGIK